jgi:2-polyprenyl-3-methyl-5-hydroxy-6-metoxy-1,4-benzoquinol methylase
VPPEAKRLDAKNQIHYAYMIRVLRRLCPPGPGVRFLDFGCGAGGFLLEARAGGYDVTGLEVSRDLARHVAETHGLRVLQGLVSDPAFAAERFDVIVSSQVFEHLTDPVATLRELREHLVPRGILLVEVPNLRDVRERLRRGAIMDDSHLFYFDARSLSWLLLRNGFRVLEVHQGLRPYRVLPSLSRSAPGWLIRAGERLTGALRVRTGLSVLARLY